MPLHDWTRVSAGTYHSFRTSWITHLLEALNRGLLPEPYYAQSEQRAGDVGPDLLTLKSHAEPDADWAEEASHQMNGGMVAVADAPPSVSLRQEAVEELAFYLARRRTLVIRHASGDRVVALVEIVSPANKHSQRRIDEFVDKAVAALRDGIHVLIIDPFPMRSDAPGGIHGCIWERLMAGTYEAPADRPLTLVSYCVTHPITAYVEPTRVGATLADMPLFLTPEHYVPTPLETTYMQAYEGVPRRWRRVIENSG